jgi:type II secretion system protein H
LSHSTAARRRGYTLVELLVVAAIVGIVASAAALAWRSDPAHSLESEARRLAGLLELAQARARIAGSRLAFSAAPQGYAFWLRDDAGVWRAIENDDPLQVRTVDERLSIVAMTAGGIAVALGQRVAISGHDPVPLSIALQGPGNRAIVQTSEFDGRMDVRILNGDQP